MFLLSIYLFFFHRKCPCHTTFSNTTNYKRHFICTEFFFSFSNRLWWWFRTNEVTHIFFNCYIHNRGTYRQKCMVHYIKYPFYFIGKRETDSRQMKKKCPGRCPECYIVYIQVVFNDLKELSYKISFILNVQLIAPYFFTSYLYAMFYIWFVYWVWCKV